MQIFKEEALTSNQYLYNNQKSIGLSRVLVLWNLFQVIELMFFFNGYNTFTGTSLAPAPHWLNYFNLA